MGGQGFFDAITGNYDNIDGGARQSGAGNQQEVMDTYFKNIPGFLNVVNNPAANQQSLSQLQQFGVPMANVGNQITAANAQAGADINRSLLTGTGAENARTAAALDREINPTADLARTRSADLMNSINLNGLSGGERAEVERSLNKSNTATGNLGLDNATNAVSNAMQFGNRLGQKRQELNSYVNTGINAGNTGPNATQIALAGTSAPQTNFGTSQFGQQNQQNTQLATSLLSNLSGIQQATIAPNAEQSWKSSDRYGMDQIGANS